MRELLYIFCLTLLSSCQYSKDSLFFIGCSCEKIDFSEGLIITDSLNTFSLKLDTLAWKVEKFVEGNYSSLIFGQLWGNEAVTISVATNEYSDNVSWDKEMEQFERLAPDIQEKGVTSVQNIGKVNWFLHREYEPTFHQLYVVHIDSIRNKMLIISMASNKEDSLNESFCKLEDVLETIELH